LELPAQVEKQVQQEKQEPEEREVSQVMPVRMELQEL